MFAPTSETVKLVLETLNAHALNFLLVDVPSGVKKAEVQANAAALSSLGGSRKGSAKATATADLGFTLVEEVWLIEENDATSVPEL